MRKYLEGLVALLMTIIMSFIAYQSSRWSGSIDTLTQSVAQLNTKMEVVVVELQHTNSNYNQLSADVKDHEKRIIVLEKK